MTTTMPTPTGHRTTAAGQAVIYTRISLDRHDGAGVARQEQECRDLAARHGLTITRVYCDNSVSAFSGATRPQFEQLLRDVQAGAVDRVLVWAVDRLYRRLGDLERLVDALGTVPVLSVISGFADLSSADGRMHARILGTVAQHSSEKQGERVAAAARQRAQAGRVSTARRPFGWTPNPDGDGYLPHPHEAPAVAAAYDMLLRGHSLSSIARWLNGEGYTGTAGGTWTQARVSELLRSPRNGGLSTYRGEVLPDVPNSDGALVDQAVWWSAHRLMTDASRLKRGPGTANLIGTRLAVCHRCGGPVRAASYRSRATGEHVLTYRCKTGGHTQVARDVLDGYLTEQVLDYLTANRGVLRQALAEQVDATRSSDHAEVLADLQRARADRDGLADALAAGALSLAAFTTASQALDARIAAGEASLAPSVPTATSGLLKGRGSLKTAWDKADLPARREVLHELIEQVEVGPASAGPDRFTITWRQ